MRLGRYALPGGSLGWVWIGRRGGVYGLREPPGGGAGAFPEYATETNRIHPQSLQDLGSLARQGRRGGRLPPFPSRETSNPGLRPERNPGRFLKIQGLIHVAVESTWQ